MPKLQPIRSTRRWSLSCGNRHHSSRIVFVNSAIFCHLTLTIIWHWGLHWFTLQPIKCNAYSIGFVSEDIAGSWNQSLKLKFEFTGSNKILEFIFIYPVVLNKNWKIYWFEKSFTGIGPEDWCSSWGLWNVSTTSCLTTWILLHW